MDCDKSFSIQPLFIHKRFQFPVSLIIEKYEESQNCFCNLSFVAYFHFCFFGRFFFLLLFFGVGVSLYMKMILQGFH